MEKGKIATRPEFPELEKKEFQDLRSSLGLYSRQLGRFLTQFDTRENWKEQARILEHHVNQNENESFAAGFLLALYHFVGATADEMSPPRPRYSTIAGKFMSPSFDEEAKSWKFDERQALKETLQEFVDSDATVPTWISVEYFQIESHSSPTTTETIPKRKLISAYVDSEEFTIGFGKDENPLRIPLDQIVETVVREGGLSILTYSGKKLPIYCAQYIIVKEKEKENV